MSTTRWEYCGISLQVFSNNQEQQYQDIYEQLNMLGQEGWEMVGSSTIDLVLAKGEWSGRPAGTIVGHDSMLFFKRAMD